METKEWFDIIEKQCDEVGTNRPEFGPVIETLASILYMRDRTYTEYIDTGGEACVLSNTKRLMKNPRLSMLVELNMQALAYWRELCLTPASLRKITREQSPDGSILERLLLQIENEASEKAEAA